jgi:hypothetical protein
MAVGPHPTEIDFGSLGAFLGNVREPASNNHVAEGWVGSGRTASKPMDEARHLHASASQAKRPDRGANVIGPNTGLPMMTPERDPFQDSATLNRKVAFKMLKQLGCQVQTVESDGDDDGPAAAQVFIEVRQKAQPVLFQMLLEFGYQPFPISDGCLAIRVEQPRQRAKDEVFAALSVPKSYSSSQKPVEQHEQPARPRMSTQEE